MYGAVPIDNRMVHSGGAWAVATSAEKKAGADWKCNSARYSTSLEAS